jgi:polar amino acid transport system substrate-binding protein
MYSVYTENNPPYNYKANGKITGLCTEIVTHILDRSRLNYQLSVERWSKAYRNTLTKSNSILYTLEKSDDTKDLFKWVGPIFETDISIFAKRGRNITIKSKLELNNFIIGVIINSGAKERLIKNGVSVDKIIEYADCKNMMLTLKAEDIDIVVHDDATVHWNCLRETGGENPFYHSIFKLDEKSYYMALHIDTPKKIISRCQRMLKKYKMSDEYKSLVKQYLKP